MWLYSSSFFFCSGNIWIENPQVFFLSRYKYLQEKPAKFVYIMILEKIQCGLEFLHLD